MHWQPSCNHQEGAGQCTHCTQASPLQHLAQQAPTLPEVLPTHTSIFNPKTADEQPENTTTSEFHGTPVKAETQKKVTEKAETSEKEITSSKQTPNTSYGSLSFHMFATPYHISGSLQSK